MSDPEPDDIPIEQALEMIAQRLGMLTASVDGVAEGQQDMLSRDYSTELAKIHAITQRMREAIITLSNKPALLQTPTDISNQITMAGRDSRKEDHAALVTARQDMQQAASTLATMTASARTAREQNQWLAGVAGLALVLGSIGGCTIPPAVDWMVPEAWYWPERRAISALHRDGWQAGQRLMAVSDPNQWRDILAANQFVLNNAEAIEKCAKRARERKLSSVGCSVEVRGEMKPRR